MSKGNYMLWDCLVELLEADCLSTFTEAATADEELVLADKTVSVATNAAATRALALVVGVRMIESGVSHIRKTIKTKKVRQTTLKKKRATKCQNQKNLKNASFIQSLNLHFFGLFPRFDKT